MQLTVATEDGNFFPVDVADDMEVENFLALCRDESNYLKQKFQNGDTLSIVYEGKTFSDNAQTLTTIGLKSGSLLMIKLNKKPPNNIPNSSSVGPAASSSNRPVPDLSFLGNFDFSAIQVPDGNNRPAQNVPRPNQPSLFAGVPGVNSTDAEMRQLFDQLTSDPRALAVLRAHQPDLAEAAAKKDFARFSEIINTQLQQHREMLENHARIMANPYSKEAQQFMLQEIQRKQIDEHMQIALEHSPETFGVVTMLYIKCKVNGHEVKAFVDTGAQATILSEDCAKACNITHLIDQRFSGIAKGVGTSKIVGRIHLAQLQIGQDFLPTSFTVLENQRIDLLVGLDLLRRYQCCVDLKKNCLVVGTTGGETGFLPENELPPYARHEQELLGDSLEESHQLNEAIANSLKKPS